MNLHDHIKLKQIGAYSVLRFFLTATRKRGHVYILVKFFFSTNIMKMSKLEKRPPLFCWLFRFTVPSIRRVECQMAIVTGRYNGPFSRTLMIRWNILILKRRRNGQKFVSSISCQLSCLYKLFLSCLYNTYLVLCRAVLVSHQRRAIHK